MGDEAIGSAVACRTLVLPAGTRARGLGGTTGNGDGTVPGTAGETARGGGREVMMSCTESQQVRDFK